MRVPVLPLLGPLYENVCIVIFLNFMLTTHMLESKTFEIELKAAAPDIIK